MASVTLSNNIADTYAHLNATSQADAVFWTDAVLGRFASDAIKRIAQNYGIFVARDTTSVVLAAGTALYNSPPRHCATLYVAVNGRPLRATSTTELERRDRQYLSRAATSSSPVRYFYLDRNNQNKIGFYPVPAAGDVGKTVEVIYYYYPCIDDGELSTPFTAPRTIGYLIESLIVAEARKQESDGSMKESSQAAAQMAAFIEQVLMSYYGQVQTG